MAANHNLPSVVSDIPRDLRAWLDRARETLERIQVQQDGLVAAGGGGGSGSGGGGGGTGGGGGGGSGALPCGEPAYPPAPTGLNVVAGFSGFGLAWDYPAYCGHSHTEVWGWTADNQGAATQDASTGRLGSSTGRSYSHLTTGSGFYMCFWIRHVNLNGVAGPFNGTGGTCATAALDPEYLLAELRGKITATQLYQDLSDRIDLIDAGELVEGSVSYRLAAALAAEADLRAADIADLQAQVSDITGAAPFDADTSYTAGDLVSDDGKLYRCIQDTTESPIATQGPTNASYWTKIGDYASLGEAVAAHSAAISDLELLVEDNETGVAASASRLDALEATVDDAETGVNATASAVESLTTTVNAMDGTVTAQTSKIETIGATVNNAVAGMAMLWSAAASEDAAHTSRMDSLESAITDPTTGLAANASAIDGVKTTVTNQGNSITAVSGRVTNLETSVNHPSTGLAATASALGGLTTTVNNQGNSITAVSGRVTNLETSVNHPSTGLAATAGAVDTLEARVDATESGITSQATLITALNAKVNNSQATLSNLWSAAATDNAATASLVTQVKAGIGGSSAAIQEVWGAQASTDGLFAQQYLKIDVAGHVSGYGLSTEAPVNETPSSTFGIRADKFFIAASSTVSETAPSTNLYKGKCWYKPSNQTTYYYTGSTWSTDAATYGIMPLTVVSAPTTINGVTVQPGVYIDGATVRTASIKWASIYMLTADWLNVINDLRVYGNLYTRALEVGEYIQSSNYVAGSAGWKIHGDGSAELSNVTVRGTVYANAGWFKGCILGGAASQYASGIGFYAGWADTCADSGTYKWRLGTPSGQRATWDGTNFSIYNASNVLLFSTGSGVSASAIASVNPSAVGFPITAANISTYINAAAIGSAYIANAAIGTAKIADAAVGTLQVASGSVTSMTYADGADVKISTVGGETTIATKTVTMPETGATGLVIMGSAMTYFQGGNGASGTITLKIYKDGTQLMGVMSYFAQAMMHVIAFDPNPVGQCNYSLRIKLDALVPPATYADITTIKMVFTGGKR